MICCLKNNNQESFMICPRCDSVHIVKNGVRNNGKQNNICLLSHVERVQLYEV
ncbi:MAG: hypothetical protein D3903_14480 [Candidatus Electrothrix sp. GM3_4]|nr:hypothetical protein [Candidatus Electrothrix sp. GM3_4]